jgi:hypothetical protein
VWENAAEIADSSWTLQELDVSALADGQPTVYLRWTMGATDHSWTYCGWNIDDIEVWGKTPGNPPIPPGDLNCDGSVDEGFDTDGDGYTTCGGDCNDSDSDINPGANESLCDGKDNDCDSEIDEDYMSYTCGTGACEAPSVCESGVESCTEGTPTEEVCGDGTDNDCDGETDEGCSSTCAPIGGSCTSDADCCSLKCRGRPGGKTCR